MKAYHFHMLADLNPEQGHQVTSSNDQIIYYEDLHIKDNGKRNGLNLPVELHIYKKNRKQY